MTSNLTREQLHERARENVKALKMASRQTAFESAREEILADLQLAELALAAMDSEPVAYISKSDFDAGYPHILARRDFNNACTMPVYAAQPVPVAYSDYESFWSSYIHPLAQDDELKGFAWDIWCAAMLQAGTLTNEDTKQAWTGIPDIDNAINTLDRIDTLESCDDDRIEAVKTVFRGLAGNSPVITDSSADMLRRWLAFGRGMQNAGSQLPHNLIAETESMLAAAPQSPGIEPATVPGKWIPVSERMPEVGVKVLCFPAEDEPIHAVFNGQLWLQDISWSNSDEPIDNVITCNVTHWVPLPASPQEVK
ncbi:TPA: DUF551 domain-containing protein [Klebsiella pneumoniae]|nr:DUF551 domain-containing protein [Klebsiella pneumoniae]